jgi:hypothetical protein
LVTGDEYVGSQQYDKFCGTKPAPEAAKVGFSVTNRALLISGTRTGRSEKVTGDEPGTCKVVTGTPYSGLEQAGDFCSNNQIAAVRQRTPVRGSNRLSGIQPGLGGTLTGAGRGATKENIDMCFATNDFYFLYSTTEVTEEDVIGAIYWIPTSLIKVWFAEHGTKGGTICYSKFMKCLQTAGIQEETA